MMKTIYKSRVSVVLNGVVLLVGLTAWGCFQEPNYSNTPQIEFKGFKRYPLEAGRGVGQPKRDSLIIKVGFKDGDGDLGNELPISDSERDRYTQAGGWGNYRIRTFRLENNQFKELLTGENTSLYFPRLSREGQTGAIEGNLELEQIYPYTEIYKIYPIKFRIQIRDRALNISNEIETDTISIPYPQN